MFCFLFRIIDLLTIRADRDVYYYGCDELFTRHPDIIQRLCKDAPTLLWTLLDGLRWRSRLTFQAQRRVARPTSLTPMSLRLSCFPGF